MATRSASWTDKEVLAIISEWSEEKTFIQVMVSIGLVARCYYYDLLFLRL